MCYTPVPDHTGHGGSYPVVFDLASEDVQKVSKDDRSVEVLRHFHSGVLASHVLSGLAGSSQFSLVWPFFN